MLLSSRSLQLRACKCVLKQSPSTFNVCNALPRMCAVVEGAHRKVSCSCAVEYADSTGNSSADDIPDSETSTDKRKAPRKQANGPTVVAQSAEAVAAGPLPDVLAATLPEIFPTLSAARRAIRKDLVLVDGTVGTCKTEVQLGQTVQRLEPVAKQKGPRVVSLEIAYEDDMLAVVHKPWGVKMYGGDGRRTITGALRAGALKPSKHPDALPEPKPVHRLDAAVGGLLVIAKTATAVADLSAQFESRRVHKVYLALLSGRLDPKTAEAQPDLLQQLQKQKPWTDDQAASSGDVSSIESDLELDAAADNIGQEEQQQPELLLSDLLQQQLQGQPPFTITADDLQDPHLEPYVAAETAAAALAGIPSDPSSSSSSSSNSGLGPGVYCIDLPLDSKPCYTLYQVLGYSRCPRFGGWMTTVALSPVTGRKHQLRQHMAALGHPIVGDGRYTTNKEEHISNQGIYLESLAVSFSHPVSSQSMLVHISEPQRFKTLRGQQDKRWHKLAAAAGGAEEQGQ